jgi:hypothetical protein
MSRDIVKVFCPRNHRVGTVTADPEKGLLLAYVAEVLHTDGIIFGAASTLPLADDEVAVFAGYCKSCKSSVNLDASGLRAAVRDRITEVHAPYSVAVDKEWADVGWDRIYPPSPKWLRHDPRRSDE